MALKTLVFALVVAVAVARDPNGAGVGEDSKDAACSECESFKDLVCRMA